MILPSLVGGYVTLAVGFSECPAELVARECVELLNDSHFKEGWNEPFFELRRPRWSSFREMLFAMEPHIPLTRYAFVPVGDGWTVCFDNGQSGGGWQWRAGRGVAACCVPNKTEGIWAARMFAGFDPAVGRSRCVHVFQDGKQWEFWQDGEPYDFEEVEAYSLRIKGDRLTPERLYRYLDAFGAPYQVEPSWPDAWLGEMRGGEADLRAIWRRTNPGRADFMYYGLGRNYPEWRRGHPAWDKFPPGSWVAGNR